VRTVGEWVSKRPTGALPFQRDWKGLHAAGRPSQATPFLYKQYLRPCFTEFPMVHFWDSDPTNSWMPKAFQEMGIRIRKWRPERVFGMQGGRYKVSQTNAITNTMLPRMRRQGGQGPAKTESDRVTTA
jgi:hypothetical protein